MNMQSSRRIILASQSPRRRDLLGQMGVQFEIMPSNFEEHLDDSRSPEKVAVSLALGKAETIAALHPDAIVIGSDTIVTIGGKQLEKPHDKAEAKEMLKLLSGKENYVSTGLAVICRDEGVELAGVDTTSVQFKPYDEQVVERYVATGDSLDKAGGYGIQSGAAPLIESLSGNYDTAMGLPTKLLVEFLARLGVEAKEATVTSPVKQYV